MWALLQAIMQANSIFVVVYSETEHKFHGRGKLHCRLCIFGVFSNFQTFFNYQVFECKPFANETWKKIEERHTCSKRQKSRRGSHRWGWWAQGPPEPSEACWMESSTGNVSFNWGFWFTTKVSDHYQTLSFLYFLLGDYTILRPIFITFFMGF